MTQDGFAGGKFHLKGNAAKTRSDAKRLSFHNSGLEERTTASDDFSRCIGCTDKHTAFQHQSRDRTFVNQGDAKMPKSVTKWKYQKVVHLILDPISDEIIYTPVFPFCNIFAASWCSLPFTVQRITFGRIKCRDIPPKKFKRKELST